MRRTIHFAVALASVALCCGQALPPQDRAAAFADANAELAAGQHAAAIEKYLAIANDNPSAEVYSNLAAAYTAENDVPQAALSYQRALLLDPGLRAARDGLADLSVAHGLPQRPRSWTDDLTAVVHPETLIILGTAIAWAGIIGFVYFIFSSTPQRRLIVLAGGVFLAGTGLFWVGTFSDPRLADRDFAVVSGDSPIEARTQPAANSDPIASLPPGSTVGVISPRGSWTYCELPGGATAWVASERLAAVEPGVEF